MSKTKKQKAEEQKADVTESKLDMVEGKVCLTQKEVEEAIHKLIVAEYQSRQKEKK